MARPDLDFDDEPRLVAALRRRDPSAFAWLLDHHDASLRRVASTFVRTGASAEEVVQETWLAVIAGIDRFEELEHPPVPDAITGPGSPRPA